MSGATVDVVMPTSRIDSFLRLSWLTQNFEMPPVDKVVIDYC